MAKSKSTTAATSGKASAAKLSAEQEAARQATLRSAEDFLAGTPSQASGKLPPGGQQLFGGLDADDAEAAAPATSARIDTRGISMRPVGATLAEQIVVILTMHLVLIVKDAMQQVPKQVYAHELPILRRIYGDENVIEKSEEDYEVTGFDVENEYDRLIRVYGGAPGAVEAIYGHNPRDLADELGLPYKASRGAHKARQQEQSLVVDNSVETEPGPTVTRTAELADAAAGRTTEAADPTTAANRQVGTASKPAPKATPVKKAAAKPAAKKTAARR